MILMDLTFDRDKSLPNEETALLTTYGIREMNTIASIKPSSGSMKHLQIVPLLLGLLLTNIGLVNAQTTVAPTPLTREQVKMERDEFMKSHRYDQVTENWVMKPGFEAPVGVKSRAEVKAQRDDFLRKHRYEGGVDSGKWVPLTDEEAKASNKSRAQVREETRQFVRTHQWDSVKEVWQEAKPAAKKSKP
jgi:hypothetical protein